MKKTKKIVKSKKEAALESRVATLESQLRSAERTLSNALDENFKLTEHNKHQAGQIQTLRGELYDWKILAGAVTCKENPFRMADGIRPMGGL